MNLFVFTSILIIYSYSPGVSSSRQIYAPNHPRFIRQPSNIRFCNDVFNEKRNRILDRFRWGQLEIVQVPFPTAQAYIGHGERVEMVEAVIQQGNLDRGSAPTQQMRTRALTLGRRNDDAGHIIARRLGGTGAEAWNIFPQNSNFNRGTWAQQEGIIHNIASGNQDVDYKVILEYPNDQTTRPTRIWYGRRHTDRRTGRVECFTGDVLNP